MSWYCIRVYNKYVWLLTWWHRFESSSAVYCREVFTISQPIVKKLGIRALSLEWMQSWILYSLATVIIPSTVVRIRENTERISDTWSARRRIYRRINWWANSWSYRGTGRCIRWSGWNNWWINRRSDWWIYWRSSRY